jgi:hypothetical protein
VRQIAIYHGAIPIGQMSYVTTVANALFGEKMKSPEVEFLVRETTQYRDCFLPGLAWAICQDGSQVCHWAQGIE